jgi:protein-disulfide isomerase
MEAVKKYWHVLILAGGLAAVYFFVTVERTGNLKFVELDYPEGFRELILNDRSSIQIDPVFGLKLDGGASEIGNQQARGKLNVCKTLLQDPDSPVIGNQEAKVTIVEFFDYRCPYCKTLVTILDQLQTKYDLRIIYKEWPILGEGSQLAARAALAADKQGRYRDVHTRLMRSGFIPSAGYIENLAAKLGMDQPRLSRDMTSDATTLALRRTSALARELGFLGTPSLVVGRSIVQGAITRAQLESLIEIEAASEGPGPC